MTSVLIVLVVILVAINAMNYSSYISQTDERLDMIERADGNLSGMRKDPPAESISSDERKDNPPQTPDSSPQMAEAPYDTRYFSAQLDSRKNIISTNMTDIASVSDSRAESMIHKAVKSGKDSGSMGGFRYRITETDSGHYLIIFLNVAASLSQVISFLRASVLVGAIGAAGIFVLMHFLTKLAMAPAETAFEKQKQFITDASHEIKTPLAIIESNAEVIEMESGKSKWLTNIRNQITRLSGLTEKLVLLSRMDEAGYKTKLLSFDLAELLRSTADEYEGKKIIIDAPDFLTYYGSRENISRMLAMLFDNAQKYSSGNITVHLSGIPKTYNRIRHHGYTLVISDPCDSLAADQDLDMLFDRFSRLDTSRNRKTGGSGIGLAVVAEIVHFHKGSVHAYSSHGIFNVEISL